MKTYVWSMILVLLCVAGYGRALALDQPSLIGQWDGTYSEKPVRFSFKEDRTFIAASGNFFIAGQYKSDISKTPHQLDLIVDHAGEIVEWRTIFQFIDENQIMVEEPMHIHPKQFGKAAHIFTRSAKAGQSKPKPDNEKEFEGKPMTRP